MTAFINRRYNSQKEARIGVIQAGYPFSYVEIYQDGDHWRFRLNEVGLADQAAELAEFIAKPKRLPEHKRLQNRKRLAPERKRLPK